MTNPDVDMLISRIVDGDATDEEWSAFTIMAESTLSLWRELACSQRDQEALTQHVGEALAGVDHVRLPALLSAHCASARPARRPVLAVIGSWSGWAVAAAVAIIAIVSLGERTNPGGAEGAQRPSGTMPVSPQLVSNDNTQVLGEAPSRMLLGSQPSATGSGYDVFYLKQTIEKMHVPDLYQISGQNDVGEPTLVRYQPRTGSPM